MTAAGLIQRATAPLDAARKVVFRTTFESRFLARALVRREHRLPLLLTLQAAVAFAFSLAFPTVLLVLGPVLFGVLHVAADVRYLVLRRRLSTTWKRTIWVFCLALFSIRVLHELELFAFDPSRVEFALTGLVMLIGCATGAREAKSSRRGLGMALGVIVLAALSVARPIEARLLFAQLHNFVALGLWLLLFRKRLASVLLPALLVLSGFGLLSSGALSGFVLHTPFVKAFGVHLLEAVDWMAPNLPLHLGVGLVCAFVFAQSIHYSVWLSLVPQDDARAEGIQSFRLSARGLLADFGVLGLVAVTLTALLVVASAFVHARATRDLYLSLAMFHGYMELVLFAYFSSRGVESALVRP